MNNSKANSTNDGLGFAKRLLLGKTFYGEVFLPPSKCASLLLRIISAVPAMNSNMVEKPNMIEANITNADVLKYGLNHPLNTATPRITFITPRTSISKAVAIPAIFPLSGNTIKPS